MVAAMASIASTALPPSARIARPLSAASAWGAATAADWKTGVSGIADSGFGAGPALRTRPAGLTTTRRNPLRRAFPVGAGLCGPADARDALAQDGLVPHAGAEHLAEDGTDRPARLLLETVRDELRLLEGHLVPPLRGLIGDE